MNQEARSSWLHSVGEDSMASLAVDEDFTNFLALDNEFSLDNLGDERTQMDTTMEALDIGQLGLNTSSTNNPQDMPMWEAPGAIENEHNMAHNQPNTSMSIFPEQSYHQLPVSNRSSTRQPAIPPTPTSDEIQGGTAYYTHSGPYPHSGYNSHQSSNTFTPLVSPAVTPADLTLRMPEYVMSGEYFSPLNSPAIEAESFRERSGFGRGKSGSGTEPVPSPVSVQPEAPAFSAPSTPALRKPRRKAGDNPRSTARNIRQSPIVKAQTRKKRGSVNLSPVIAELAQKEYPASAAKLSASGSGGSGVISSGSSAQDSVSPEPLSDALMPPPAAPRSVGRSPMISASTRKSSIDSNEPATPATLMKLRAKQLVSPNSIGQKATESTDAQMEDLQLPEAAAFSQSSPTELDPGFGCDGQVTPTILAKTPKLSGQMTPRARPASSSGISPQTEPISSPKETEQPYTKSGGTGRGAKKRQSTSSSQISPALRPKISPSIKPLMPQGGSISAETSALYLASKSNYQNIIEGTHLPGISYPEALAENLSSKRTSHKIAEQGRRNRINTALKEIEALLPQSPTTTSKKEKTSKDVADDEKAGSVNQSSSKANTVEMAIAYIKELQEQVTETKAKLDAAEKKLAETNTRSSESASVSE